jgi:hypothetical protein
MIVISAFKRVFLSYISNIIKCLSRDEPNIHFFHPPIRILPPEKTIVRTGLPSTERIFAKESFFTQKGNGLFRSL